MFHHIVSQLKTGVFDMAKDEQFDKELLGLYIPLGIDPSFHCPWR